MYKSKATESRTVFRLLCFQLATYSVVPYFLSTSQFHFGFFLPIGHRSSTGLALSFSTCFLCHRGYLLAPCSPTQCSTAHPNRLKISTKLFGA